jgi:hypothetical protein
MQINTFRAGDPVMIVAKDQEYAFVDGWRGRVGARDGLPDGYVRVMVKDDEMDGVTKQFFVPCDQVALMVGR